MPLYSYKCSDCGYEWDEFRTISERNEPINHPCSRCGKNNIIRCITSSSYMDSGVMNGDKNMEKSGVLSELNRIKEHHPYMKWG